MRFSRVILLSLMVLLFGCASTPENLQRFQGKHYKELIMAYGKPQDTYFLDNGNKVYIFEEDVSYITDSYAKYKKRVRTFEVDKNGVVVSSRSNVVGYEGPGVVRKRQSDAGR